MRVIGGHPSTKKRGYHFPSGLRSSSYREPSALSPEVLHFQTDNRYQSQLGNLAFSAGLGWWGFPWGFLFTPVQIVRNIKAMVSPPDPAEPSAKLIQVARVQLASRAQVKPSST
jgi:hypothetical protein